jgi:hypothetical protein
MNYEYFANENLEVVPTTQGVVDVSKALLVNNTSNFVPSVAGDGIEVTVSGVNIVDICVDYNVTAVVASGMNDCTEWGLYRNGILVPGSESVMAHVVADDCDGRHSVSRTTIVQARPADVISLRAVATDVNNVEIPTEHATLVFKLIE